MKKGFTLLEMIVTIVILGILSAGTFVALQHLYLRSAKSKTLSELSLESQVIVDQIAYLMYDRIPSSVIGYDGTTNFQPIYSLISNFTILEWIGVASEAHKLGAYSGFVDMNASNSTTFKISTAGVNKTLIDATMVGKFGAGSSTASMGLVFAGSFDDGAMYYSNEFNTTFGWHNNPASKIFNFTIPLADGNITLAIKPNEIYEKYYLVDSAYAVARGADVNVSVATCNFNETVTADTLFLFYGYRPWAGETFCGDRGAGGVKAGGATILSQNVSGFEAGVINGTIYFNLTMNKHIRGNDNNITISKQKAVY